MILRNFLTLTAAVSLLISGNSFAADEPRNDGESNSSSCNGAGELSDLAKSRLSSALRSRSVKSLNSNLESSKEALVVAYETAAESVPSSRAEASERKKIMRSSELAHQSIVDFQETSDSSSLQKAAKALLSSKGSKVIDEELLKEAKKQREAILAKMAQGGGCNRSGGGD